MGGDYLGAGCKVQGRGYVRVMLTEECFSFGRNPPWEVFSGSSPSRIKKKKCH